MIYCAVLEDEIEALAPSSPHRLLLAKLPQGLHNEPKKMPAAIQEEIDSLEEQGAEAIALGYGLCSRGTEGVKTRVATLVMPRAHDCITLLLGSKEAYSDWAAKNPATYWYSTGWNRHHIPPGPDRLTALKEDLEKRFDPEDAEYVLECESAWMSTYDCAAFVDPGIVPCASDCAFTEGCAKWLGWRYEKVQGSGRLFRSLLNGDWSDDDFLVLPPGQTFRMTADSGVVEAVR